MIPGLNKRVINFYDLMLYIALARKHLRLMVLLICMCVLCGLAVYVYARPVYYSRALVRIDETHRPVDSDSIYHDSSWDSIVNQMKSPLVMERVARRLGLNADFREIQSSHIRSLRFSQNPEGEGMEVEVYSYERSWPARWTEVMVEEVMRMREEYRTSYRLAYTKDFTDVMGEAGTKIDQGIDGRFESADQQKMIKLTMEVNQMGNVPDELVRTKQRLDRIDETLRKLDDPDLDSVEKLSLIDSILDPAALHVGQVIMRTGSSGASAASEAAAADAVPQAPASPTVEADSAITPGANAPAVTVVDPTLASNSPEWMEMDRQQRMIKDQIAEASRIYLPGHRKMVALRKQLEAVEQNLNAECDSARHRLEMEREGLATQIAALQKKIPAYQELNRELTKIQQHSQLHAASQVALQGIYTDAEKYLNELEYTADKERINIQYLGMLDLKQDAVSPNKSSLLLYSALVGVLLGFAIPFLIEYLDFTLSNLEEVESTFQMRGLGIIPQLESSERQPMLLGVGDNSTERNLVENMRVVRTNLLAMGTLSKQPHVTMITSAMPKEGKTVVSSNLALSFAKMGEKTLLIDTDLRRGRLHRLFGLRKSPGLSDVLLGKVSLEEALRPSGKENLLVLSAGEHLETGTELLSSPQFTELMQTLRARFQRIVMDTPPVLGLSETSILQNHVDGVLFVIWSGRTPIRNMKTALEILQANGANFYGFILNRLDLSSTANYYQYYYYSSDYYHSYHALENA